MIAPRVRSLSQGAQAGDALPAPHGQDAGGIVFAIWTALSALLLLFVLYFGPNVPYQDDFAVLAMPDTLDLASPSAWWTRINEHRLPVALALIFLLSEANGNDLRWFYVLNALCVIVATGMTLLVLRTSRGRSSVYDLIVPLGGLSLTHSVSFLMVLGLFFAMYYGLCLLLLSAIAMRFWRGGPWFWIWAAGLPLLPITGGMGLGVAGPMTLYSGWVTAVHWRRGGDEGRGRVAVLALSTLLAAVLGMTYVLGDSSLGVAHHPEPVWGIGAVFCALRVLSMSAGIAVGPFYDGYPRVLLIAAGMLAMFPLIAMFRAWIRNPESRIQTVGYAAMAAGVLAVAGAIGVGRAGFGEKAGLSYQYTFIVLPLALSTLLLTENAGGRRLPRAVGSVLLLVAIVTAVPSGILGWRWGEKRRNDAISLTQDIQSGYSLDRVAEDHQWAFFFPSSEVLAGMLQGMKTGGWGPFSEKNMFLLGELPAREFRRVKLRRGGAERRGGLEAVQGLRFQKAGSDWIIDVEHPRSSLRVHNVSIEGSGEVTIRIEMLSPVNARATLTARGTGTEEAGEDRTCMAEVRPGSNTLDFRFPSATLPGAILEFSPADMPERFRMKGVSVLEHPVSDSVARAR